MIRTRAHSYGRCYRETSYRQVRESGLPVRTRSHLTIDSMGVSTASFEWDREVQCYL